ncbi:MAG: L-threonylcarbamoyladenylate synthase, partial [Alphaproteobacteria bacterium]
AVAAIFAAKGRPRFNPLIAHVPGLAAARRLARFDAAALALARAFWPGPLTLVLPRREGCPVSWLASAGLPSIAIRVPAHPVALELLRATGRPVVAPSANRSGRVSPTRADHVARDIGGRVALILDGGPCGVGVESTVVDLSGGAPALLRPGGLPKAAIEAVLGRRLKRARPVSGDAARLSPGQVESHYAPRAGEAYLAYGNPPPAGFAGRWRDLSPRRDLAEAAANLFAMLRELDRRGTGRIAVAPVPRTGLGLAINDRLVRAAAPR